MCCKFYIMYQKIIKFVFFCFVTLLLSCNANEDSIPPEIISPENIVPLIVEIHISDGILISRQQKSRRNEIEYENFHKAIFKKYGYTRAQFDSSIGYYSRHLDIYESIYENVMNELRKKEAENKKNKDKIEA